MAQNPRDSLSLVHRRNRNELRIDTVNGELERAWKLKDKIRDLWLRKRREYESQVNPVPFLELDEFREVLQAHGFSAVNGMTAKEIEKAWYKLTAEKIREVTRRTLCLK